MIGRGRGHPQRLAHGVVVVLGRRDQPVLLAGVVEQRGGAGHRRGGGLGARDHEQGGRAPSSPAGSGRASRQRPMIVSLVRRREHVVDVPGEPLDDLAGAGDLVAAAARCRRWCRGRSLRAPRRSRRSRGRRRRIRARVGCDRQPEQRARPSARRARVTGRRDRGARRTRTTRAPHPVARPTLVRHEGRAGLLGEQLAAAGAQVVVARPVEQVVDPVAQDLRPQVPDPALAQQREVVGVVEQRAGGARVGGDPAEPGHLQQRAGELPQPVQDGQGRPRRSQQPVLVGLRAATPSRRGPGTSRRSRTGAARSSATGMARP